MVEFVDRRGSNCYKWDSEEANQTLPLWVADMDFKAAPAIINAIKKRVEHGVFGYNIVPNEYYNAVASWFERKHGWKGISRENSIATIGVIPALSAVLKAYKMRLKEKGIERKLRVMTFTPAYNCFFSSIRNIDCELVDSKLIDNNGRYEIDILEKCKEDIAYSDVLLLCNPHNPTGRVWTKQELNFLYDICKSNGTEIISDEIHAEIIMPKYEYTPFATIAEQNDNFIVLTSASKAFNIAGLQCANIYTPNKKMYSLIDKAINIHEICDLNSFAITATIAAYNNGEDWLKEVNDIIYQNYELLKSYIIKIPQLRLTQLEGTYLAWVNISKLGISAQDFCSQLRLKKSVLFNPSEMYGAENYIRINLATSKQILTEALDRLFDFIKSEFV